jgi:hypothetical protein
MLWHSLGIVKENNFFPVAFSQLLSVGRIGVLQGTERDVPTTHTLCTEKKLYLRIWN